MVEHSKEIKSRREGLPDRHIRTLRKGDMLLSRKEKSCIFGND